MTVLDPGSRVAISGAGLRSGSKDKPRARLTASQKLTCPEAAGGALPPLPHAAQQLTRIQGQPCSVWGWRQGSTRAAPLSG